MSRNGHPRTALYRFARSLASLGMTTAAFGMTIAGLAAAPSAQRSALSADRTAWDSVYSATQAGRGESLYVKSCARCHRASLSGGDESPPLAGGGFLGNWNGVPLSELESRIRTTMPPDSVGIYDRRVVTDVIAYLLKANGFPSGPRDLASETDSLATIMLRVARPSSE
jgi:mono/diheme cytochrome c family protein